MNLHRRLFAFILTLICCCALSSAQTSAPSVAPVMPAAMSAEDFAAKVDLAPLRSMAVQHMQTVKTLDSFSRQVLEEITGRSTYNGQDPVFTILDMAYRPDDYIKANIIKIANLPLRTRMRDLTSISDAEKERIVQTGMVSLDFLEQEDVKKLLAKIQSDDIRKGPACNQVELAKRTALEICLRVRGGSSLFLPAAVVPPAVGTADTVWHPLMDVLGTDPEWTKMLTSLGASVPPALPGYKPEEIRPALGAAIDLTMAWQHRDATAVNTAAVTLADALAKINPGVYPSSLTRQVEVVYNKLTKMTLPGAAFYFVALVFFLMSATSGSTSLRLWGLRFLILGFCIHSCGIAVRWWLTGTWLPPIKNEFESVMFSAWFGVCVGIGFEIGFFGALWNLLTGRAGTAERSAAGRGILGAAASFVGWLSLIALFTVPYVLHTSIGENIGQSAGVLMSYWLYIHVTMVTASYAMIGMAFLLGCWWLTKYYMDYGTLSRTSSRQLEGGGHGFEPSFPAGGGSAALTMSATLARMLFFPVAAVTTTKAKSAKKSRAADEDDSVVAPSSVNFLASLDACNLVVLQIAFWTLGIGIVLGAIWADESWGRPWAWDPKETFALVTWIAYLIIVHVRVATNDKAWWTSVLSIAGFFLMLFNWIGVNYFLPGLHSYAG